MKTLKYLAVFGLICFLLPRFAYSANLGDLRISLVDGDVQINTNDTKEWVAASINMPLTEGDRVWVPEGGKAELQLRDGTVIRLAENTSLDLLHLDNDSSQFYLNTGNVYVSFIGARDSLLQLDTPITSLKVYDPSKLDVVVPDDNTTNVSVFKGVVYSENKNGRSTISEGKELALSGTEAAETKPVGQLDAWEKWNMDRDKKLYARSNSSRYLPGDLANYSSDFDSNGRWVRTADYGYVWTPTVGIGVDWAPYRDGRWVWIDDDYVWVGYEPWGWVPYHYGRWYFNVGIGWCWVPPFWGGIYWGPGFVGWVNTGLYVSWVPLAPREIYYGHGYYGPFSVNMRNINTSRITVNRVYQNARVNNAVTTWSNERFLTGRNVPVRVTENPFLTNRVSIGGPGIRPTERTRMPVEREIPANKRPPENVRNTLVSDLRESHPIVKDRSDVTTRSGGSYRAPSGRTAGQREFRSPAGRMGGQRQFTPPAARGSQRQPTDRGIGRPQQRPPSGGSRQYTPPAVGQRQGAPSVGRSGESGGGQRQAAPSAGRSDDGGQQRNR